MSDLTPAEVAFEQGYASGQHDAHEEIERLTESLRDVKATKDARIVELVQRNDGLRAELRRLTTALTTAVNEYAAMKTAIHQALAHGDRTRLGTVRPGLADAVNPR